MGIETKIDELVAALTAHTAALSANTSVLERVVAGQAAAMEKLEGGKAAGGTGRGRGKAAAAPETPATTESAPATTTTAAESPAETGPNTVVCGVDVTSDDALRAHIAAYLNRDTDAAARKERGATLASCLAEMGTKTFVGEEGVKDINDRRRLAFYVARAGYNLPVDFKVDYDFDGDPRQGSAAEAPASDEFDIG